MATYYVRKDGNDTTGDGSTGSPWLTISKAILTADLTGPHTINVGAGTYQESTSGTGYLYFNRSFLAETIVQSESGNPDDVIVQSLSSTTFTVRIGPQADYVTLKDLTITPRLNTMISCVRCQDLGATFIKIQGCKLLSSGAASSFIIYFTQPVPNFSLIDSEVTAVGAASCVGVRLQVAGHNNVTIDGCTITTTGTCIYQSEACSNFTLTDTTCTNTSNVTCVRLDWIDGLLVDGLTATATGAAPARAFDLGNNEGYGIGNPTRDFIIRNSRFESVLSHGLLISSDAQNGVIEYCTVIGGDQGIVLKGVDNVLVRHCYASTSVSGRAGYFKEAYNSTFHDCRLVAFAGTALSADDAQSSRWTHCVAEAHNSAQIYQWTGTNTLIASDNNHYILTGAAVWGNPNGVVCTSLAEVRAAWSGVFANNDAKSNQLRTEA